MASVTHTVGLEQVDCMQGIFLPNRSQVGVKHRDDSIVGADLKSVGSKGTLLADIWDN